MSGPGLYKLPRRGPTLEVPPSMRWPAVDRRAQRARLAAALRVAVLLAAALVFSAWFLAGCGGEARTEDAAIEQCNEEHGRCIAVLDALCPRDELLCDPPRVPAFEGVRLTAELACADSYRACVRVATSTGAPDGLEDAR